MKDWLKYPMHQVIHKNLQLIIKLDKNDERGKQIDKFMEDIIDGWSEIGRIIKKSKIPKKILILNKL